MKNTLRVYNVLLAAALALAACGGPAAETETASPAQTGTPPSASTPATLRPTSTPRATLLPADLPSATPRVAAPALPPLQSAAAVAAGWTHTCALLTGGDLKCWGKNTYGQLGDGTTTSYSTPVDVAGLATGAAGVAVGVAHTCALTVDGAVKCWGWNYHGQLGDGTNEHRSTPVDVTGLAGGVTAIAAGDNHTCALTDGGEVICWGSNVKGQLGDGTLGTAPTFGRTEPAAVTGLESGVVSVSAGGNHTCAVTSEGTVLCWGANDYGQLGSSPGVSEVEGIPSPRAVLGLAGSPAAIAAGANHTCVLLAGEGVHCWGHNGSGQLGRQEGIGSLEAYPGSSPVDGLASGPTLLASGVEHNCVVAEGGGVQCWGFDYFGQVGDGNSDDRDQRSPIPEDVDGLQSGVAAIAARGDYTCAVTLEGGVKCWGQNHYGQLGNGTTFDLAGPGDVLVGEPVKIPVQHIHACPAPEGAGILPAAEAESLIADRAAEAIRALSEKDLPALAALVHPGQGVLVSPSTFVNKDEAITLSADQVRSGLQDGTPRLWGYADGSGDPIELAFSDYLDRVAYGYDFARADMVGYNQVLGCGTTLNNAYEAFPQSIVVEYHFPGFHPRFEAFDWQSLRLVFQEVDGAWYLVGLLNDHWTI